MTFLWPMALVGLLLVPLLIAAYLYMGRRTADQSADATLGMGYDDVGNLSWKRHLSPILSLLAVTSLLVGFARPQTTVDVPKFKSTVVLVFDTSQSMAADDVEPTRLDAAKAAATTFVESQDESVEIGIVSFGSTGAITLRPSGDRNAVLASIDRLQAAGGTSLNEGLFAGLSTIAKEPILFFPDENGEVTIPPVDFGGFGAAIVVLYSDGEDTTEQDPTPLAELASRNGIRVYPVGVGTAEGAVLDIDGFSVSSVLMEESLQGIADASNGTYYRADSLDAFDSITDSIERDLEISEEFVEVTNLFGLVALVLLAAAAMISMFTKGRTL